MAHGKTKCAAPAPLYLRFLKKLAANPGGPLRGALLFLLLVPVAAAADPDLDAASPPALRPTMSDGERGCVNPVPPASPLPPEGGPLAPGDIDVRGGNATVDLDGVARFQGNILLRRGDMELGADRATYDRPTGDFSVEGNVVFHNADTFVRGDAARYDAATGTLRLTDAEFDLFSIPARGNAAEVAVQKSGQVDLEDVTYSSCSRGDDDWSLHAGQLSVDRDSGVATARDAHLEFMGVPILYSPYLTYPVTNERRSGLLLPDFGSSSQRGVELATPYYLNLAPNYDLTLTPHYMSRRGLQANGEFRYLTEASEGTMTAAFLPNDKAGDQDDRTLLSWLGQTALPLGWRGAVDITDVSDPTYFEDLGNGLAETSQTFLRRRVSFDYYSGPWSMLLRFDDYENLDQGLAPDERPYRMLPQFAVRGFVPRGALGLQYLLDSELTWFDRDVGVNGLRFHAQPQVGLPLNFGGVRLEPAVAVDYTAYNLKDLAPGEEDTPSSTIPVYSVDLSTVFERNYGSHSRWLQTLEPRAEYVYVPYHDQNDQPVFDTIEPDFSLVQLFRKNRFVGLDRFGDTNQINLGLTTRLIRSDDGSQFLTATIGESFYFSDQKVLLPGQQPSDANSSDYIAELGMNINDQWNLKLGYQWDSDQGQTQLGEARVLYHPDDYRVLSAAYQYRRDTVEEINLAAAWPVADHWNLVGHYNYSFLDNEPGERFAGVEYSSCCWSVRVVARRYLATRTGGSDTAFTVQLLLKGLGNGSKPAEQMLERGILGYDRFDRY